MSICDDQVIETEVFDTIIIAEDDCSTTIVTDDSESPTHVITELIPGIPGPAGPRGPAGASASLVIKAGYFPSFYEIPEEALNNIIDFDDAYGSTVFIDQNLGVEGDRIRIVSSNFTFREFFVYQGVPFENTLPVPTPDGYLNQMLDSNSVIYFYKKADGWVLSGDLLETAKVSESAVLLGLYSEALGAGYTGTFEGWVSGSLNRVVTPSDAGKFLTTDGSTTSWTDISASTVGLSNVDNTSDMNKPISTATAVELAKKLNTADFASELDATLNSSNLVVDQGVIS